jgi:hypothetical protein
MPTPPKEYRRPDSARWAIAIAPTNCGGEVRSDFILLTGRSGSLMSLDHAIE